LFKIGSRVQHILSAKYTSGGAGVIAITSQKDHTGIAGLIANQRPCKFHEQDICVWRLDKFDVSIRTIICFPQVVPPAKFISMLG